MARRWMGAVAGVLAITAMIHGSTGSFAVNAGDGVPHFASLHSDKVNLRTGPGDRYPIEWVFVRRDWPVEVVGQFDHWRRVRDWQGTEGWVHEKMINNAKREVVVMGDIRGIRQAPDIGAALVARAEPGVVAQLLECRPGWCRIGAGDVTGWIARADIWGVYPSESVP